MADALGVPKRSPIWVLSWLSATSLMCLSNTDMRYSEMTGLSLYEVAVPIPAVSEKYKIFNLDTA